MNAIKVTCIVVILTGFLITSAQEIENTNSKEDKDSFHIDEDVREEKISPKSGSMIENETEESVKEDGDDSLKKEDVAVPELSDNEKDSDNENVLESGTAILDYDDLQETKSSVIPDESGALLDTDTRDKPKTEISEMDTLGGEVTKEDTQTNVEPDETPKPPICTETSKQSYQCSGAGGYISIKNGENSYNITTMDNEYLLVYISDNTNGFSKNCSVKLGDLSYDTPMSFLQVSNPLVTSDANTVVTTKNEDRNCEGSIFYRKAYPFSASFTLEEPEGIISSPDDPDGIQFYRPRSNLTWSITAPFQECSIVLNITEFYLGSQIQDVKGNEGRLDLDVRDYVITKPNGENSTSEWKTLVGKLDVPRTYQLDYCSATIEFVSHMHYQNATGFSISYKIKDTTSQLSPKDIPVRSDNLSTWVSLNGVTIQHESLINDMVKLFKKSVAKMANAYLDMKDTPNTDIEIRTEDVLVAEVASCNYFYCRLDCTAFHFIIDVQTNDSQWLFNREELNKMVHVDVVQKEWEFQGCMVCLESTDMTWGYPVLFLAFVMIFSFGVICFAICTKPGPIQDKRRNNLNDILESWERDRRSRSISEASSSTANSRSSLVTKKFTLPVIGKRETFKDPEGIQYDVREFKNFGSKETKVDPKEFGFDADLFEKKTEVTFFSNEAYNDEDESEIFSQNKRTVQAPAPSIPQIQAHQSAFGQIG